MSTPASTARDRRDRERVLCRVDDYVLPTGQELRELRILSGLTIREAADRAGVSTNSIQRWENDEITPRIGDARTLLEIYAEVSDGQTQLR